MHKRRPPPPSGLHCSGGSSWAAQKIKAYRPPGRANLVGPTWPGQPGRANLAGLPARTGGRCGAVKPVATLAASRIGDGSLSEGGGQGGEGGV